MPWLVGACATAAAAGLLVWRLQGEAPAPGIDATADTEAILAEPTLDLDAGLPDDYLAIAALLAER
jgi:hypothetical protein